MPPHAERAHTRAVLCTTSGCARAHMCGIQRANNSVFPRARIHTLTYVRAYVCVCMLTRRDADIVLMCAVNTTHDIRAHNYVW